MRIPSYRLHSSGKARVTILGKDYMLGVWQSDESKNAYKRLIAEFLAQKTQANVPEPSKTIAVSAVVLAFLNHAKVYYKEGKEYKQFLTALRPVSELYCDVPAGEFGPLAFKAIREHWSQNRELSRQYVNKVMKRVNAFVKWAVSEGMMPADAYVAIKCVAPLKAGRTHLREAEPVKCVPDAIVEQTAKYLPKVVADMIEFQQLTGCRPGEVCLVAPGLVDRTGDVWEVRLPKHKTAYRGKSRTIYVGPLAQEVLKPYLDRDPLAACFSPAEAMEQRIAAREAARVTPMNQGNRRGYCKNTRTRKRRSYKIADRYTGMTYGKAIGYACRQAFQAPDGSSKEEGKAWHKAHRWSPNQLRHSAATKIRKKHGVEAASVILRHSDVAVTQIYAEADREKAITICRSMG